MARGCRTSQPALSTQTSLRPRAAARRSLLVPRRPSSAAVPVVVSRRWVPLLAAACRNAPNLARRCRNVRNRAQSHKFVFAQSFVIAVVIHSDARNSEFPARYLCGFTQEPTVGPATSCRPYRLPSSVVKQPHPRVPRRPSSAAVPGARSAGPLPLLPSVAFARAKRALGRVSRTRPRRQPFGKLRAFGELQHACAETRFSYFPAGFAPSARTNARANMQVAERISRPRHPLPRRDWVAWSVRVAARGGDEDDHVLTSPSQERPLPAACLNMVILEDSD